MRAIHTIDETPRNTQGFSDKELAGLGVICATAMTLIALIELARLTFII